MVYGRALAVWLVIILAETCHGVLRNLLLSPVVGDLRARQIGVAIGSTLIFFISLLFIKWINAKKRQTLLLIGLGWVLLTLAFEISLGRLLHFSWQRIFSDYNPQQGGFMLLGMLWLFLSPYIAAKIRKPEADDSLVKN